MLHAKDNNAFKLPTVFVEIYNGTVVIYCILNHLQTSDGVGMTHHRHLASNASPALLRRQIPDLDCAVCWTTHQTITLKVEAAHSAWVTNKGLHGPWIVCSNIPQLHNTHTKVVSFDLIHLFILFWHASLGVLRHQSPEWTILSHINCFIQGEVMLTLYQKNYMIAQFWHLTQWLGVGLLVSINVVTLH